MLKKISLFFLPAILLVVLLTSCNDEPKKEKTKTDNTLSSTEPLLINKEKKEEQRVYRPRQYKEIKKSGVLRVLTVKRGFLPGLQRYETQQQKELRLLEGFAEWLKLDLKVIYLDKFEQLIPELIKGRGDIISSGLTITNKRKRQIDFSRPITVTREHLVTSLGRQFDGLKDLEGQTVVVRQGASYWQSVNQLRKKYPGIKITTTTTDTEELLYMVGANKIAFTVADEIYLESYQHYRHDIKSVYTFPEKCFLAYGINKGTPALKQLLNIFIKRELSFYQRERHKSDLPEIKKRKVLRVITRDNPINYFIHRGQLMGFEYELAKKFAKEQGLRLVIVVPPDWGSMETWLTEGRGDIIAASVTATPERKANKDISLCTPYTQVREVIVTRANDNKIKNASDLKNRTFAVRMNSSYWHTLKKLRKKGLKFKIKIVPDEIESYEILQNVADGKYDITLVDDIIFNTKKQYTKNLKAVSKVGPPKRYSWMVRSGDSKLKEAVNKFFKKYYKSRFFNVLYYKYCKSVSSHKKYKMSQADKKRFAISPYDPLVIKYSSLNKLNWQMISAQIFHESSFNPQAVSHTGAKGLMQLMPTTAAEMKCNDPFHPGQNIKAGTGYLYKMKRRFKGNSSDKDKLCFALASYNGGIGHVFDARKITEQLGLNREVWKDNVEIGMKKLTTRKYASKARYGFCKGYMISKYVDDILLTYEHYEQDAKKNNTNTNTNTVPPPRVNGQ